MPRLKRDTSLWRARMERAKNQTGPGHPASMSVLQVATAEETFASPDQQDANSSNTSTTHISQSVTRSKSRHGGASPWVRRTTRNVNEVSTGQVPTEEEQLQAALAESLAQEPARPAQKDPVRETRKRKSKSRGPLTSQKAQESLRRLPGQHTALKLPKLRITNDRIVVVREVDSLAQSLDTEKPLDAFDLEKAKELEHQQQLLFLSNLERQEGYIRPAQGEHESAMRSTLAHDVDNDDFTAAFILRAMANSDITADPDSMGFVQRLMNPSAPGTTLESTNSAKNEKPREVIPLRRSTRKKPAADPEAGNSSSKAIETEKPAPEPLRLDEADLAGQKTFLNKSLRVLGTKPKGNAADQMVKEMEIEHAQTQQDVEMAMEEEDRWNELWGVEEWEE
ncbi:hypothetical protein J4E93_003061 [Alternaria ventricosa]|uniref:uncharacterized protein n=1 Tax=Alternaria ventricosa TaxID=1187951 RepID=UPI0020C359F5|nr:uncharacterized protein J4E93_003061 [Alternaria ventricosa]KAI4650704.1 hypothetical protein J4E93_003061 [Alternaria ventricosa]